MWASLIAAVAFLGPAQAAERLAYTLLALHDTPREAGASLQRLQALGLQAELVEQTYGGKNTYVVRWGRFDTAEIARSQRDKMAGLINRADILVVQSTPTADGVPPARPAGPSTAAVSAPAQKGFTGPGRFYQTDVIFLSFMLTKSANRLQRDTPLESQNISSKPWPPFEGGVSPGPVISCRYRALQDVSGWSDRYTFYFFQQSRPAFDPAYIERNTAVDSARHARTRYVPVRSNLGPLNDAVVTQCPPTIWGALLASRYPGATDPDMALVAQSDEEDRDLANMMDIAAHERRSQHRACVRRNPDAESRCDERYGNR